MARCKWLVVGGWWLVAGAWRLAAGKCWRVAEMRASQHACDGVSTDGSVAARTARRESGAGDEAVQAELRGAGAAASLAAARKARERTRVAPVGCRPWMSSQASASPGYPAL